MFPNSNFNKQFSVNKHSAFQKANPNIHMMGNGNMPQFGSSNMISPQQYGGTLTSSFGGEDEGNFGNNNGTTPNFPRNQYGGGNMQAFGGQNGPQQCNIGHFQPIQNRPSSNGNIPIQNQHFNMSTQLQSFRQKNISNIAQKSHNQTVPNLEQSGRQNMPVFHGQIPNRNEAVMQNKVQDVEMRTLQNPGPTSKSQSLGLLPVSKVQVKKEESTKDGEKPTNQKPFYRFGDSLMEQTFIFTGTAERLIRWGKIFENRFCLFEVISAVIQIAEGKVKFEKILLLRDKKGPVLQVTYFSNSTHVNIENFHFGQMLSCVGRMVGSNILSASAIRAATPGEIETLPRMCCACDRAVQYFCAA